MTKTSQVVPPPSRPSLQHPPTPSLSPTPSQRLCLLLWGSLGVKPCSADASALEPAHKGVAANEDTEDSQGQQATEARAGHF